MRLFVFVFVSLLVNTEAGNIGKLENSLRLNSGALHLNQIGRSTDTGRRKRDVDQEIKELEEKIKGKQDEVNGREQTLNELKKEVENQKKSLEEAEKESQKDENKINGLKESVKQAEDSVKQEETELQKAKAELQQLQEELDKKKFPNGKPTEKATTPDDQSDPTTPKASVNGPSQNTTTPKSQGQPNSATGADSSNGPPQISSFLSFLLEQKMALLSQLLDGIKYLATANTDCVNEWELQRVSPQNSRPLHFRGMLLRRGIGRRKRDIQDEIQDLEKKIKATEEKITEYKTILKAIDDVKQNQTVELQLAENATPKNQTNIDYIKKVLEEAEKHTVDIQKKLQDAQAELQVLNDEVDNKRYPNGKPTTPKPPGGQESSTSPQSPVTDVTTTTPLVPSLVTFWNALMAQKMTFLSQILENIRNFTRAVGSKLRADVQFFRGLAPLKENS
ncbi:hypothetical protein RUM44_011496 [Polyplax serrata]|uniref:Uncharacterized protein n=1 Tax=Polyplax serrata TaxID=468196 RepID=A0ABR1AQ82_POLSC